MFQVEEIIVKEGGQIRKTMASSLGILSFNKEAQTQDFSIECTPRTASVSVEEGASSLDSHIPEVAIQRTVRRLADAFTINIGDMQKKLLQSVTSEVHVPDEEPNWSVRDRNAVPDMSGHRSLASTNSPRQLANLANSIAAGNQEQYATSNKPMVEQPSRTQ